MKHKRVILEKISRKVNETLEKDISETQAWI